MPGKKFNLMEKSVSVAVASFFFSLSSLSPLLGLAAVAAPYPIFRPDGAQLFTTLWKISRGSCRRAVWRGRFVRGDPPSSLPTEN